MHFGSGLYYIEDGLFAHISLEVAMDVLRLQKQHQCYVERIVVFGERSILMEFTHISCFTRSLHDATNRTIFQCLDEFILNVTNAQLKSYIQTLADIGEVAAFLDDVFFNNRTVKKLEFFGISCIRIMNRSTISAICRLFYVR